MHSLVRERLEGVGSWLDEDPNESVVRFLLYSRDLVGRTGPIRSPLDSCLGSAVHRALAIGKWLLSSCLEIVKFTTLVFDVYRKLVDAERYRFF